MKILVTGGAGFIGGNFIQYMLKNHPGCRMVCLDKLTYAGNLSTLAGALNNANFTFVRGDIADSDFVCGLFARESFDAVVNFAAESHVDRSISGAQVFMVSNVVGVQVLLDACNRYGVRRFHQISTDEVYGDLPLGSPSLKFTEESPLRPSSPYAASKAAADLIALASRRTYGTFVTISRSSNNYGPYQHPEKLIPLVITRALAGENVPVYGDGQNVREWISVFDHCRAVDLVLQNGESGEIYNVGGGVEMANIDLVELILNELGVSRSLIEFVPDRKGHDRRYSIDSNKMAYKFGWRPQTNFLEGIKRTVRWYKNNRDWCRGSSE